MADLIKPVDDFKAMLDQEHIPYIELPMSTLLIKTEGQINLRQYYDNYCLSSWVSTEEFKEKVSKILNIESEEK